MSEFDPSKLLLKEDTLVPFGRVFRTWSYPPTMPVTAARGLKPDDDIVSVEMGKSVRGYPVRSITAHHIVHDRVGDREILVTFCDVCHSAVVFEPLVRDRVHHFDVSGIYQGMLVMRDRESRSEWLHFTGECVQGPLRGEQLPMVSSNMMTWDAFGRIHPEAEVITDSPSWWRRLIGLTQRTHTRGAYMPSLFERTLRPRDRRLSDDEYGLGVVVQARSSGPERHPNARFYPYRALNGHQIVTDEIAETPIVVLPLGGRAAVAFEAVLSGVRLALTAGRGGLVATDDGSLFDEAGRCVQGPRKGARLSPAVAIASRWYGFSQTYPDATIWGQASA